LFSRYWNCFDRPAPFPGQLLAAAMARSEPIQGYQGRLTIYRLDDRTLSIIRETWPVISGHLEAVIDNFLVCSKGIPLMADAITHNLSALKALEMSHFTSLLSGDLGDDYVELCRKTVKEEAAMGLDARYSQQRRESRPDGSDQRDFVKIPFLSGQNRGTMLRVVASHRFRCRECNDATYGSGGIGRASAATVYRQGDRRLLGSDRGRRHGRTHHGDVIVHDMFENEGHNRGNSREHALRLACIKGNQG
jgi:hypothetical protein